MPRKVEIFTQGCEQCEDTVSLVKSLACLSCEVTVFDLNKGCETNECQEKAEAYGVTQFPSVVVDGKLLDCCKEGNKPSRETLVAAGIGAV